MTNETFILQKKFTVPIGHRLSKHSGLCKNVHGHAFSIIVSIKCKKLNDDDMVIDFSNLKDIVYKYIKQFDHGLMLNKDDPNIKDLSKGSERVTLFDGDPTAENLAKYFYEIIEFNLSIQELNKNVEMDFVRVFENENSSITYSKEWKATT